MKGRDEAGFTLIEIVVAAVIMTLMVAAVGSLFVSNLNEVVLDKARAIGLGLANQQMEYLRDLPYDSLATQFGTIYPPGTIADNQTQTQDNYKFRVHTTIVYIDDPYDGNAAGTIPGKPKDLYPYDYKRAQVDVYLVTSGQLVATLTTDIAGKAAETASDTGILDITVLDANGQPVPQANVSITNTNQNPAVNIQTTTDNDGVVVIPKLPPDSGNNYQVIASLPGYSTDGTKPNPGGGQKAVELNPNVIAQQITPVSLSIDQVSTLYLHVTDTSGNPISNLSVTTTGAKQIYTDPTAYKYSQATATDSSGNITLSGMEWDSYSFSVPAGHYVVSSSPVAPAALEPNSQLTVNLVVSTSANWPTITSISPASSSTGTSSQTLTVNGTNLSSATVQLAMTGQTAIPCTGVTGTGTQLTCTLNLTSAATGNWDVDVTNSTGTATESGGFDVTP